VQLWGEIFQKHPRPSFTRKSVVQLWSRLNSHFWKRDEDEVRSAWKLLEEHRTSSSKSGGSSSGLYMVVEPIPIEEETGVTAIAFTLPGILRQWGGRIREIQLDSACEFEQITTVTV
jgi:hypothetical protein